MSSFAPGDEVIVANGIHIGKTGVVDHVLPYADLSVSVILDDGGTEWGYRPSDLGRIG